MTDESNLDAKLSVVLTNLEHVLLQTCPTPPKCYHNLSIILNSDTIGANLGGMLGKKLKKVCILA